MKNNPLRKLARSMKYQFLYSRAKEMSGSIRLLKNDMDFSDVQITFLQWVETYHMLYTEKQMGDELITDEIIDDDLRTEAYLAYRNKYGTKHERDQKNENKQSLNRSGKVIDNNSATPGIVFKNPVNNKV